MRIGARVLKTGIAVTLALFICKIFKLEPASFAAITVVVNMQPSVNKSLKNAWEQVRIHVIGVILATLLGAFLGNGPIIIGLAVILIILLANRLGWSSGITLGIVSIVFILDSPPEQFILHAGIRSITIFIGLGVALLTNRVLAPPRYKATLHEKLQKLFLESSSYFQKSMLSFVNATNIKSYEKVNLVELEGLLDDVQKIHEHTREELTPKDNALLIEKLIEISQGFIERGQNIEEMTYQRVKRRLSPDSPLQHEEEISPEFQRILNILLIGEERIESLQKRVLETLMHPHEPISPSFDPEYWTEFDEAMDQWQRQVSGIFYLRAMMEVAVVAMEMRWAVRRLKRIYNLGTIV